MKYYIIAGEASGDLYGSRLIDEIKLIDKEANIRFWGGDKMIQSGGFNVKHIKELAFMGFYEVLKNILTIWKNKNKFSIVKISYELSHCATEKAYSTRSMKR